VVAKKLVRRTPSSNLRASEKARKYEGFGAMGAGEAT